MSDPWLSTEDIARTLALYRIHCQITGSVQKTMSDPTLKRPVLLLNVSTTQGPELHLDVSTLQRPVPHLEVSRDSRQQQPELPLDLSTLQRPVPHLDLSGQ
jgi:hypothetical protein